MFVIDPDSSFNYFTKVVEKKLKYIGALVSPSIYFYSKGKQLHISFTSMGEMFDRYRTE